jgi:transcription antitermination factor NusG
MNKNWYAVYTKTQCEKKVAALLSKKKIENTCPLNCITSNQGNRRKMAYEPLFPSFVFVYISEAEMRIVRQTNDIINFVYWLGKPAVIKAAEIENVLHFANTYHNIKLEKTVVNSNGIVRITNEPQLDLNVDVISLKTTRIRLSLPSLGFAMTAESGKTGIDAAQYGHANSGMLM